MIRTVSATHTKNSFGEIIKQVYAARDHVIVEKGGIPVVAIIPISEYAPIYANQEKNAVDPQVAEKISYASGLAQANQHLRQQGKESEQKEKTEEA